MASAMEEGSEYELDEPQESTIRRNILVSQELALMQ
jgi:hypothetical protein